MTLDEFFVELAKAKPKFKIEGGAKAFFRLVPLNSPNLRFCPLTALAYIKGKEFSLDKYVEAGLTIGLSGDESREIAKAADHGCFFNKELRSKLSEILL